MVPVFPGKLFCQFFFQPFQFLNHFYFYRVCRPPALQFGDFFPDFPDFLIFPGRAVLLRNSPPPLFLNALALIPAWPAAAV
jgi:hypothetical protein